MNILVIPDKFKDSLSTHEVVNAISKGVLKQSKLHKIFSIIASDGGDGFLEAISNIYPKFSKIQSKTVNPLGKIINSYYLLDSYNQTAYIELAQASGLELLKNTERDCSKTSTFGTGLQINQAIENGAKKIYIGLGGSATNDAGLGILQAIGFKFLDQNKTELNIIGNNIGEIQKIIIPSINYKNITFFAVNDVNNLLLGKNGATYTYALQKGAKKSDLPKLEKGMNSFFELSQKLIPNLKDIPGFGAAGGTCFGLSTFLNAKIISGIDFIFGFNEIDKLLFNNNIDIIITGEGKIDDQTYYGKFIKGVTDKAKKFEIPVIAICGVNKLNNRTIDELGLYQIHQIKSKNISTKSSMENASELIENKICKVLNHLKEKPLP